MQNLYVELLQRDVAVGIDIEAIERSRVQLTTFFLLKSILSLELLLAALVLARIELLTVLVVELTTRIVFARSIGNEFPCRFVKIDIRLAVEFLVHEFAVLIAAFLALRVATIPESLAVLNEFTLADSAFVDARMVGIIHGFLVIERSESIGIRHEKFDDRLTEVVQTVGFGTGAEVLASGLGFIDGFAAMSERIHETTFRGFRSRVRIDQTFDSDLVAVIIDEFFTFVESGEAVKEREAVPVQFHHLFLGEFAKLEFEPIHDACHGIDQPVTTVTTVFGSVAAVLLRIRDNVVGDLFRVAGFDQFGFPSLVLLLDERFTFFLGELFLRGGSGVGVRSVVLHSGIPSWLFGE